MNISTQSQAVLLMTAWFTKPGRGDPKPLTPSEWGRFAHWLKERGAAPDILITCPDPTQSLYGWSDRYVTIDRIAHLLGRAGALGLALEKWQRAGLWIMTRSDTDYPVRLKKRLRFDAPPVLFGCGNRQLLDRGGVAVVGSRDATDADLAYTSNIAGKIAAQGESVVSGGARGVDEAAMQGALDQDGTVIGVLADSLLRAATSAKYRNRLISKNLVLVSPFSPETSFEVGNAMARNKYIYCLADAAVVIATSKGKGGTWAGAVENLRTKWVPLSVKKDSGTESGSMALVDQGARWLPESHFNVADLFAAVAEPQIPSTPSLFDEKPEAEIHTNSIRESDVDKPRAAPDLGPPASISASELPLSGFLSLYEHFLLKLAAETSDQPLAISELSERLCLNKSQLSDWLKQAVAEGKATKLNRPIRFQIASSGQAKLI